MRTFLFSIIFFTQSFAWSNIEIIGGERETSKPWFASLISKDVEDESFSIHCGGALISPRLIMTAAHCVVSLDEPLFVAIGLENTNKLNHAPKHKVSAIFSHPNFSLQEVKNDVAILVLEQPTTQEHLSLPRSSHSIENGDILTAYGFGNTSSYGNLPGKFFKKASLEVLSNRECRKKGEEFQVDETQFCAFTTTGGQDTCQGDSGGPFLNESGELIGIVSYGKICAQKGQPGVYTRVSQFLDWVSQVEDVLDSQIPIDEKQLSAIDKSYCYAVNRYSEDSESKLDEDIVIKSLTYDLGEFAYKSQKEIGTDLGEEIASCDFENGGSFYTKKVFKTSKVLTSIITTEGQVFVGKKDFSPNEKNFTCFSADKIDYFLTTLSLENGQISFSILFEPKELSLVKKEIDLNDKEPSLSCIFNEDRYSIFEEAEDSNGSSKNVLEVYIEGQKQQFYVKAPDTENKNLKISFDLDNEGHIQQLKLKNTNNFSIYNWRLHCSGIGEEDYIYQDEGEIKPLEVVTLPLQPQPFKPSSKVDCNVNGIPAKIDLDNLSAPLIFSSYRSISRQTNGSESAHQ